jgi:HK97 family phage major capsid protein
MELQEVKTLIEEQGRLVGQLREKFDAEMVEVKKFGQPLSETKTAVDALNGRLDAIETKLARKAAFIPGTAKETEAEKSVEVNAMEKWFRFGEKGNACFDRMTAEEKAAHAAMRAKSLSTQTDLGGGQLVPEDFQATVIQKVANIANVGARVSSITTSRDVVRWPKVNYTTDDIDNSGLSLTYEDTADSATTTDPTPIGNVTIQTKKARGLVLIDRELLEDSAIDVTALVASLMADKIAVDKDRQFTKGVGGKFQTGFMTNGSITTKNSGSSGAFLFDGIIDLTYALPGQYAENGTFMTSRASMGLIRKLKDSQNRYLWEPSTQAGTPASLNGYPIVGNEHIAAAAAASKSLIFADFKRLYMAVNKIGLSVQRLDEKYADTDQVGFIFRLRFGGDVVAPWAAVIQVLS